MVNVYILSSPLQQTLYNILSSVSLKLNLWYILVLYVFLTKIIMIDCLTLNKAVSCEFRFPFFPLSSRWTDFDGLYFLFFCGEFTLQ